MKFTVREMMTLAFFVAGGVIVGWLVAAEIWYELLMKLSPRPQIGRLAMLLLFLVAMVSGGDSGAWLANVLRRQRAEERK